MDTEKLFESIELTDEVKAELNKRFGSVLSEKERAVADADGKLKEAIETRDKAKAKSRELEEKIASGNTESAELLKMKSAEIDSLSAKISELTESLNKKDLFVKEVETDRKNELLGKLPEGKLREVAGKIDNLELLKEHVETVLETYGDKTGTYSKRGGVFALNLDNKNWDDFTSKELAEIKEHRPDEYKKLYNKKYKRR